MKKQFFPLLAVAVFALISSSAMADQPNENTLNSQASLKVVNPIAIEETADLNFGVMGVGWGGSVNLSPETAERTAQNAVYLLPDGTEHVANYNITGSPNSSYIVTYDASFNVSNVDNDNILSVVPSIFIASKHELDNPVGTLNEDGQDSFSIGGSVNFSNGTKTGDYSGRFNVTVNYN